MAFFQFAKKFWMGAGADTCWVYIHLPKTAGSSLSSALTPHFGGRRAGRVYIFDVADKERSLEIIERARFRFIGGHLGRQEIERLEAAWPNVRFRYFTFLRDPVTRLISAYRHAVSMFGTLPKPESIDLTSDPAILSGFYNTQTRQLAYGYDFLDTPKNVADDVIYSRAVETINRCEFVGLYEHLDSDLHRLRSLIGIRRKTALPVFKSTKDVKFDFDSSDLRQAGALTRLDSDLYKECLARRGLSIDARQTA